MGLVCVDCTHALVGREVETTVLRGCQSMSMEGSELTEEFRAVRLPLKGMRQHGWSLGKMRIVGQERELPSPAP